MAELGSRDEIRKRKKVELDGIEVENRIRQEVGLPTMEPEKVLDQAYETCRKQSKKEERHPTEKKAEVDVIELENRILQEIGDFPMETENVMNLRPLENSKDSKSTEKRDNEQTNLRKKNEIIIPKEFTPDLAKFIALIMTDGSFFRNRISIKNTSYSLIEEFKNLATRIFKIKNFHEYIEIHKNPNAKPCYCCKIYSKELSHYLAQYIDKSDREKTKLPDGIFNLPEKEIGEILKLAFSSDGSVGLRPYKNKKNTDGKWLILKRIEFACFSLSLINQWKKLIESLGIKCRFDKYTKTHLIITGKENILKFKEK